MKRCSYCGEQNEDDSLFCTECGKPIPQGTVCPHCGAEVSENDVFCTNCGRKLDEESTPGTTKSSQRKCHNCGTLLDKDDAFCPNCGISLSIEPVPTDSHSYEDDGVTKSVEKTEDDLVDNQSMNDLDSYEESLSEIAPPTENVNVTESEDCTDLKPATTTYNKEYSQENEYKEVYDSSFDNEPQARSGKFLYSIGVIVIICVVGVCIWNYYSSMQRAERNIALTDSLEKARRDSLVQVRMMEKHRQDSIDNAQLEEKKFLEKFYWELANCSEDGLLTYIQKNVTNRAFRFLKDEYPYEDGCDECYATWMFTREEGCDYDKLLNTTIEQESENTFLVTNIWGYEHDGSYKFEYKVRLGIIKEGDSYKIDSIEKVNSEERQERNESKTDDLSWLQGHWVYKQGNYEGHIKISGNTIQTYSSKNPSPDIGTFTIIDEELLVKTRGSVTAVKIDFVKHKIDWGEGQWMQKVSSGADQNYSSSDGASSLQLRQSPFRDEQDIMARLYNQRFRHSSGLEIRIDGYGRIEIDGDAAGVISVLRYNSESALLRYGNGVYGEGKIMLKINGDKLLLQDTADGSLFYQR